MSVTPAYLWFDAEFSSLDLDTAELLQVAVMATNAALDPLSTPEEDLNLFIQVENPDAISPWVREHIPQVVEGSLSEEAVEVEVADNMLAAYVDRITGGPIDAIQDRPLLAGNSVHNDWLLARRLLPAFVTRLHYRLLDVSTIKVQWRDHFGEAEFDKDSHEQIRQYFPAARLREGLAGHDAYYDIQASIAELGFYRSRLRKA
jgi:oligoribonuclease